VVSPLTILDDYPIRLNDAGTAGYPKNSPNSYGGMTSITTGVQRSINTIATRTLQKLSTETSFYFMENNLGFDLDARDNALAPLAMGGLTYGVTTEEMAAAFASFANGGVYTKPRTILRIADNNDKVILENDSDRSWVAMKESTAYLMNKLLVNAVNNGTGTAAKISGMTVAGKTGTTNDNFDRYFTGYTPYYSAAVWVGYAGKSEKIEAKVNPAAKVWQLVMSQIHEGLENKGFFDRPSGVTSVTVCADCGLLPSQLCSQDYRGSRTISGEVQEGAVPTQTCTCHVSVTVCTDPTTGDVYLAGDYCPEDTTSTRVMLQGREFLTLNGSPILAEDSAAHLTYLEMKGACPIHDASYTPEEEEPEPEPVPGDDDYQWPDGFDMPDWWPWTGGDDDGDDQTTTTPTEPDDQGADTPDEPGEPSLPDET
jgi:penicillin-binding protein 1A